jgi:hypothetical protein
LVPAAVRYLLWTTTRRPRRVVWPARPFQDTLLVAPRRESGIGAASADPGRCARPPPNSLAAVRRRKHSIWSLAPALRHRGLFFAPIGQNERERTRNGAPRRAPQSATIAINDLKKPEARGLAGNSGRGCRQGRTVVRPSFNHPALYCDSKCKNSGRCRAKAGEKARKIGTNQPLSPPCKNGNANKRNRGYSEVWPGAPAPSRNVAGHTGPRWV